MQSHYELNAVDRSLVHATQSGLPLVARPFDVLAGQLGLKVKEVLERLRRLQHAGVVRRIGAVPNHYRLGYVANGMSVWDIADDEVERAGHAIAELDFVTHCYRRPRRLPVWPYNLFAMVHGKSRSEVDAKVTEIKRLLGDRFTAYDVLYSTRILKKTGIRLRRGA